MGFAGINSYFQPNLLIFRAAITRFLCVSVQVACDRWWKRAIGRRLADHVCQIAYFFAKARPDAAVMVFDDFVLKTIAGGYPRLIVAIGDVG